MTDCGRCGTPLQPPLPDNRCPKCGTETHFVQAAFTGAGTLRAKVTVPYDQTMPWRQKWRDIATGVKNLQSTYVGNVIEHDAVRQQVEDLFADLRELADYLDHQEFGGGSTAQTELHNYHALDICDGLVQTTKHHTRNRRNDPITGKIAAVHGDNGVSVDIAWSRPSGPQGTEDALDLAQRCVRDWRQFFTAHNLTP
jgi:hypothetical protein